MNAVPAFLLLAALSGAASGLFWRKYVFVNEQKNWVDAQAYCRQMFVDLATIDNWLDYFTFINQASTNLHQLAWTGLSRNLGERYFTRWSDGSPLENQHVNRNYASDKNCVSTIYGSFKAYYCGVSYPFFCYKWETNLIVVKEMMTWKEALDYCRTNYTDLINLDELTDQLVASNVNLNNETGSFWTGLHFLDGSWFWTADMSLWTPSSFPSCPNRAFACGARKAAASTWENRDCEEKLNFICYNLNMAEENVWDLTNGVTDLQNA